MRFQIFNGREHGRFELDGQQVVASTPEDAFDVMIDENWEVRDGQFFFIHNVETGVGFIIRANISPRCEFIEEIAE